MNQVVISIGKKALLADVHFLCKGVHVFLGPHFFETDELETGDEIVVAGVRCTVVMRRRQIGFVRAVPTTWSDWPLHVLWVFVSVIRALFSEIQR